MPNQTIYVGGVLTWTAVDNGYDTVVEWQDSLGATVTWLGSGEVATLTIITPSLDASFGPAPDFVVAGTYDDNEVSGVF